jgi:hypothetical protein
MAPADLKNVTCKVRNSLPRLGIDFGCAGVAFIAAKCHDLHVGGPEGSVIHEGWTDS